MCCMAAQVRPAWDLPAVRLSCHWVPQPAQRMAVWLHVHHNTHNDGLTAAVLWLLQGDSGYDAALYSALSAAPTLLLDGRPRGTSEHAGFGQLAAAGACVHVYIQPIGNSCSWAHGEGTVRSSRESRRSPSVAVALVPCLLGKHVPSAREAYIQCTTNKRLCCVCFICALQLHLGCSGLQRCLCMAMAQSRTHQMPCSTPP